MRLEACLRAGGHGGHANGGRRGRGGGLPQDNASNYDKGVLAEILEPIMGKGLIPADLETWKPRRRAIVPAFHKAYLQARPRRCCRPDPRGCLSAQAVHRTRGAPAG